MSPQSSSPSNIPLKLSFEATPIIRNTASTISEFAHLLIPLEQVLKATNNFHHDNIISHGDFGPAYRGQLLRSGQLIKIAARRLDRKRGLGEIEFWTEVSMLSDLNHTNLE
ncbi:hypothetical protein L1987_86912 [Smallanthus sonchifolius]|uniref:Uncharacterized protein n=1 Tax=Smallanthus sonchifolius TaxID=185202 RepID=A0ACB8Y0Q8_9ASTR|nr:hypothetical protein L1987_86912 [Smallanthus sonchifolius]